MKTGEAFMLENFRTYQLAVRLYRLVEGSFFAPHIRSQILRSSSSIAANLAEGSAKSSPKDQARFYEIAYGSCQETQAFIALEKRSDTDLGRLADSTGASIYRLISAVRAGAGLRPKPQTGPTTGR